MKSHPGELISTYIDGELTDTERSLVEYHLKSCDECRALVEKLSDIKMRVCAAYQSMEIPELLVEKVMDAVENSRIIKGPAPSRTPWLGITAIVMAFLLVLLSLIPIAFFGAKYVSVFNMLLSLLRAVPVLIAAVPSLLEVFSVFALSLLFISVWSLSRLLSMKEMG